MGKQSDTNFKPFKKPIITADFGNTRVKFMKGFKFFSCEYENENWKQIALSKMREFTGTENFRIFYSSVNKELSDEFFVFFSSKNKSEVLDVGPLITTNTLADITKVKNMGSDRILGLIGAKTNLNPPFITIDCGTAITLNVMDKNSVIRGGAIFPGLFTMARSLFDYTSSLELVTFPKLNEIFCGTNPTDAIRNGILGVILGGAKELIRRFEEEFFEGKEVPLVFTGGYGFVLFDFLKGWRNDIFLNKNLVLDGVFAVAKDHHKPQDRFYGGDNKIVEEISRLKVVDRGKEDEEEDEMFEDEIVKKVDSPEPKKRGRKPKFSQPSKELSIIEQLEALSTPASPAAKPVAAEIAVPKKRGRKPRALVTENVDAIFNVSEHPAVEEPAQNLPKKRGPKPKNLVQDFQDFVPKKRGRISRLQTVVAKVEIERRKVAASKAEVIPEVAETPQPKKRGRKPRAIAEEQNVAKQKAETTSGIKNIIAKSGYNLNEEGLQIRRRRTKKEMQEARSQKINDPAQPKKRGRKPKIS